MAEQHLATLQRAINFLGGRAVMVPGAPRWYRDGGVALRALEVKVEQMRATLEYIADGDPNERHDTVAETRYWMRQYKLRARQELGDAS